jgi:YVTN family beta-propeller protein
MQFMSRRARIARLLATTLFVAPAAQIVMPAHAQTVAPGYNPNRTVGPQADGSFVVNDNQTLTPAGKNVVVSAPTYATAINPNPKSNTGAVLTKGGTQAAVVVFNTVTGEVVQNFASPSVTGSYNGIAYSADGTKLFFSQNDNHFVAANVDPATGALTLASSLALPSVTAANPNPPLPYYNASLIIPGAIALSPDGSHAFVVLSAANTLGVVNLTGAPALQTQIPVGNAPNSVVISADGHYAYVSNQGGRKAVSGDFTSRSDGAAIVADPNDAFALTGTVSVVDLTTNTVTATIDVGLQPVGMTISGSHLYVANSSSDTISVIDLHTNKVVGTIDVGVPIPGRDASNAQGQQGQGGDQGNAQDQQAQAGGAVVEAAASRRGFGSGPNAITVVDGRTAYVTLGQANAIAVIDLSNPLVNPVVGYIPTAYFPTSVVYDAVNKQLVVANGNGIGDHVFFTNEPFTRDVTVPGIVPSLSGFVLTDDVGTVNLVPLPNASQLVKYTEQVLNNNHWSTLNPNILVGPEFVNSSARPVPVPKHIGEPSTIKHVFLIIKENRTYDVELGDLPQGNGDPSTAVLAIATPNVHALVRRFPLLDNTYAIAHSSADGHHWITAAGAFYEGTMWYDEATRGSGFYYDDALANTPRGFLWSAAQKKGLSVKLYGESGVGAAGLAATGTPCTTPGTTPPSACPNVQPNPATGQNYAWADYYNTALCIEGKIPAATCATLTQVPFTAVTEASNVPSAQKILDPHYPSFNVTVPDQYRVDYWLPMFNQQVATNMVPNLTIMWLPMDHLGGGGPLPASEVADNDLAVGRVVEAISHSKVWESSAIFVEQDDPGGDPDHVDSFRMPAFVISPWTAPPQAPNVGKVVHTIYTHENVNRTIEQILGFEPLTQFDLVASPMFDAFGEVADFTPWTHVPETFPLNLAANGTYLGWSGLGPNFGELELTPLQKAWIEASNERTKVGPLQKAWIEATDEMTREGKFDKPDVADPNFMSHMAWYWTTDWKRPYPGETEIMWPDYFLKAALKKELDGDDDDDDLDEKLMKAAAGAEKAATNNDKH